MDSKDGEDLLGGLYALQDEVEDWRNRRFGDVPIDTVFRKFVEEVGELSKSISTGNYQNFREELGDCVIMLLGLAAARGASLASCVLQKWETVKQRGMPSPGEPRKVE